ncbi:MAG: DMT family transporter [bacterium]|nr:DMT family transporter [bacterium]
MGIVYIILSGICFLIVNFFVKTLGPGQSNILTDHLNLQEYPAHELVLARSVVSFVMSYTIIRRKKLPVFGVNKKWLLIRGLAGTAALTIFFYTMHYLPLAVALTIQYLAPIFTIIFAMILLKERIRWIQWPFIALAFGGTLLLAFGNSDGNAEFGGLSPLWLGAGMIAAVLSGVAYVAIMKLKPTDAPITIVMYFPMIAIPFMILLCLFEFTVPQGIEWLFLLIIGIFTQFAQITMTRALHSGNAATIVPFQYLGAIYGFLVGYFIFLESLSNTLIMGMILVLTGVVVNSVLRQRS